MSIFRYGLPEAAGISVVGATIGAALGGAILAGLTLQAMIAGLAGGFILPVLLLVRWTKLANAAFPQHPVSRRAPPIARPGQRLVN